MWPTVDRINLTMNLAHLGNQLAAFPREVRVNLTTAPDEDSEPLSPQDPEYLIPRDPEQPYDLKQFESNPASREHLLTYTETLRHLLYEVSGGVYMNAEAVTGKGQISSNVMKLMYAPLLALTKTKQQCQGEAGISVFLSKLCQGLCNSGVPDDAALNGADVTTHFPGFFEATEDEKLARVSRFGQELSIGLKPLTSAVRENASADGLLDIDDLIASAQEFEAAGEARVAQRVESEDEESEDDAKDSEN
jgi:hypothetical protein